MKCPMCLGTGKRGFTNSQDEVITDAYDCSHCSGTGKKPKQRWDGAGKNKAQRKTRKQPLPNSLMRNPTNASK